MPHKICPQCGKDFYTPASKVICCSVHCAHAMRDTREQRICKYCGASFTARKRSTKQTCSVKCRGALVAKQDSKVVKTCKGCGKSFESWTYRRQVYCSLACKNRNAKTKRPYKKRERHTIQLTCEYCHQPYEVHQSQHNEKRRSRFCSVECRGKHFSETNRGANHPNWRGGGKYPDRGRNWSAQRRLALIRDNHSCQVCHQKMTKANKHLIDVHHITPYRQFNGNYLKANNLNNLITLCRSCHKKVEHGKIPCPVKLL